MIALIYLYEKILQIIDFFFGKTGALHDKI